MASSTQSISGLASGIDTSSIIDQLMSIERAPQTRLKTQLSVSDARKQVLTDIQTRLKNLQLAAQDLKSPTLWLNTQSLDVNDTTKVAASRTASAGTGSYQLTVSQLARGSQRWFAYTPPASDDTITFSGGHTTTITAGSDIDAAATAINSDSAAPVYATAVTDAQSGTKYLVFSSRVTGQTASAFTASGSSLAEDATRAVSGLDSQYSVDGGAVKSSASNVVTDAIPGVQLTLKGVTTTSGPVTVTVGAPAPDLAAVSAKMKAFVDQYNSTLDFVRSKLDEKKVVNPTTVAEQNAGLLHGDTMLEGVLSQLRIAVSGTYAPGNPTTLDEMSEIGVSTGSAVGSGTLNQDAIEGKLVFDSAKFTTAITNDPQSVRNLMSGSSGFGQALDNLLAPTLQADGTMASRLTSEDTTHKRLSDQIAAMDVLLNQKQATLKSQFTAMETALQASQAQGQWLQGQIAKLG
ncbi:MAG: flagellar hook-associated protein 2 [Thermoleophilaceae bacterium]|jgi:flagellar hook-associated protein 2|nr:flagellar hook-associated protein 2 [Thermoleophilaceae bacterium]